MEYAVPFKEAFVNAVMCKRPLAGADVTTAAAERVYGFSMEELFCNALAFFVGGIAADTFRMKKEVPAV